MIVGYFVNNIIALFALYGEDEDQFAEIDFTNFILTIPIWPLTLFQMISAFFSKDE
jgi:hypothetical protein